jgi:hypothetical protein
VASKVVEFVVRITPGEVAIKCCLVSFSTTTVEPLTQAESIADQLAQKIETDRFTVKRELEKILGRKTMHRILVFCGPWALVAFATAVKLIIDSQQITRQKSRQS